MAWDVELHSDVEDWILALDEEDYHHVAATIDALVEVGPTLTRPHADTITGSRHHNMKELRPRGGNLRILFAFDPRRTAILLVAGDKTNNWTKWYDRAIPVADQRYDEHLASLE